MMELAILENLQREDLTPIEEAEAYQKLMENLNFTQEQLANRLGKSRPHIANHVRLLSYLKKSEIISSRVNFNGTWTNITWIEKQKNKFH